MGAEQALNASKAEVLPRGGVVGREDSNKCGEAGDCSRRHSHSAHRSAGGSGRPQPSGGENTHPADGAAVAGGGMPQESGSRCGGGLRERREHLIRSRWATVAS